MLLIPWRAHHHKLTVQIEYHFNMNIKILIIPTILFSTLTPTKQALLQPLKTALTFTLNFARLKP